VLLDSESVKSLLSVTRIEQLCLADRKLQMFPTGLFNLTNFRWSLKIGVQIKLPFRYMFSMSMVLSAEQKVLWSTYFVCRFYVRIQDVARSWKLWISLYFSTCVMFKFIQFKPGPSVVQRMSISSQFAPLYSNNLSL